MVWETDQFGGYVLPYTARSAHSLTQIGCSQSDSQAVLPVRARSPSTLATGLEQVPPIPAETSNIVRPPPTLPFRLGNHLGLLVFEGQGLQSTSG